jgi:hypothetical protein
VITRGTVLEYDLSYNAAQDLIDYYCPYGKAAGLKIREGSNVQSTTPRVVAPAK